MAALVICRRNLLSKILEKNGRIHCKFLSTSERKKKSDEAFEAALDKKIEEFRKPLENKFWVSYGFDKNDKGEDRFRMHVSFFSVITVLFCGATFIFSYMPDVNRLDWARREALIRLTQREELGLDPIDCNYVDPDDIILPQDSELEEKDIII